ncbi:MAG: ferredoxin family protein [Desulfobacterales bacterium]|nr:MAG: ferredoxin family protein [Desulfobacterales bacterium]
MNLCIDSDCCTGCGACVEHCPGHVLSMGSENRPCEKYPDDCWYCGVCAIECPAECITVIFPYLIR